ncbi:MAG: hypothetical protein PGN11_09010 [Quadrisphaera sp.]
MAAGAGEVELVDLSADDDAPGQPGPPSHDPPEHPSSAPRRRSRSAAAVAVLVVGGLVAAGAWQHRSALADQRAAARAAALAAAEEERMHEGRAGANALEQRLLLVRSASRAVGAAAGAGPADGQDGVVWWPADLGPRAARADEPVDLQVVGVWPQAVDASGTQRIGYRLVTGLSATSGSDPCSVPAVRIADWSPAQGGGAALGCRVMAAGLRGTAVREGGSAGAGGVRVREVVLVSDGRAASVAVWSTGGADLPLDGPELGAAAAALLAAVGS